MNTLWTKEEKEAFRVQHPTKYPIEQAKHNSPKADVKTFADLVFAADYPEYKGLVTTDADYYITKAQTWDSSKLFAVNAIWVDIDAHEGTPSFTETKRACTLLIHALPELAGIPVPNIIVYTGRGFHLVWAH